MKIKKGYHIWREMRAGEKSSDFINRKKDRITFSIFGLLLTINI